MRLTREKIVRISYQIVDLLVQSNEVEFIEDRDTIRQHMVQTMTTSCARKKKSKSKSAKKSPRRKKKFSKAAKSGTCCSASIIPTNSAAPASPPLPKSTRKPATAATASRS